MRAGAEAASYTSAASLIRAAQSMAAVEEAAVKVPSNKLLIAQQLRRQTPMSRQWVADRLRIGSASYISDLLGSVDSEL
jgi:hypothetical protein